MVLLIAKVLCLFFQVLTESCDVSLVRMRTGDAKGMELCVCETLLTPRLCMNRCPALG